MLDEAALEETPEGLRPAGPGWFVLNVADAAWAEHPAFGAFVDFENREGDAHRARDLGVNVHVLKPGASACLYHSESVDEAFLVLSGECLLVVEEQERRLKPWDFFRCPAGTRHVFVGLEGQACAVLMIGARREGSTLHYPVSEVAGKHGASAEETTPDPRVAYARFAAARSTPRRAVDWPLDD